MVEWRELPRYRIISGYAWFGTVPGDIEVSDFTMSIAVGIFLDILKKDTIYILGLQTSVAHQSIRLELKMRDEINTLEYTESVELIHPYGEKPYIRSHKGMSQRARKQAYPKKDRYLPPSVCKTKIEPAQSTPRMASNVKREVKASTPPADCEPIRSESGNVTNRPASGRRTIRPPTEQRPRPKTETGNESLHPWLSDQPYEGWKASNKEEAWLKAQQTTPKSDPKKGAIPKQIMEKPVQKKKQKPEPKIRCPLCDWPTPESKLRKHMDLYHADMLICTICDRFVPKTDMGRHQQSHQQPPRVPPKAPTTYVSPHYDPRCARKPNQSFDRPQSPPKPRLDLSKSKYPYWNEGVDPLINVCLDIRSIRIGHRTANTIRPNMVANLHPLKRYQM